MEKEQIIGMPATIQLLAIERAFPNIKILSNKRDNFEIEVSLQPSSFSEVYRIKIIYKSNIFVKVFVVGQVLKISQNRTKLPHVYNSEQQQLCLFSPSKKEWKPTQYILNTIIPWASEWLYYYELWLIDGNWYGGGHNEYPNEESNKIIKDD